MLHHFIYVTYCHVAGGVQHSVGSCFNTTEKYLTMTCDEGHMVKLDRVYFGRSATDSCQFIEGDCTLDVPDMENYPCVGQQSCQINLPSGDHSSYMPKCDAYGNYMQTLYQCIPGTADIHTSHSKTLVRTVAWAIVCLQLMRPWLSLFQSVPT